MTIRMILRLGEASFSRLLSKSVCQAWRQRAGALATSPASSVPECTADLTSESSDEDVLLIVLLRLKVKLDEEKNARDPGSASHNRMDEPVR